MDEDQGNGSWVLPCGHEVVSREQVHYCEYISLAPLLALVGPNQATRPRDFHHHDEFQFVVVHQMTELAFGLHLRTLRECVRVLAADEYPQADHLLKRLVKLIKYHHHLVSLLMSMTPEDFFKFRAQLAPASGAESYQFREIEILSGLRAESPYFEARGQAFTFRQSLDRKPGTKPGQFGSRWWLTRFNDLLKEPSLAETFDDALVRKELNLSDLFAPIHKEREDVGWLRRIARHLYEYETAFLHYREQHAKVAHHHIGGEPGTGGSEGVGYLRAVARIARFHPRLYDFMSKRVAERGGSRAWDV